MIDLFKRVIKSYSGSDFDISLSYKAENYRTNVFLNGKKENTFKGINAGVMISVAKDGRVVRQAIPTINEGHLKNLIQLSRDRLSSLGPKFLPEGQFEMLEGELIDLTKDEVIPINEVFPVLLNSSLAHESWIDFVRTSLTESSEERITVNSRGGVFHDKKIFTDFYLNLMGSRDSVNQNRSNGDVVFQGAMGNSFLHNILETKDVLKKELNDLLSAPVCPKMKGDLVLPSDQMYIQIHESIGHPLELDRILGDERNYAGGSFVKPIDFGRLQYGPEMMNVVFAASENTQPAGQSFDDTGLETTNEYLIKNGKLVAGIGGFESQKRSGLKGTSSTRSSNWNRPPIDRMGNINLLPGESKLEEMISSVENGVLMRTNRSWSIDDQRDKFQFGCEIGQVIKDGELKEIVRAPNYEGRTIPFWNSLKMIGDESTVGDFGTSNCGKGEPNQAIRVGHRSPACLFSNISIFPGE